MSDFIEADTELLQGLAGRLDPAPALAVREAATRAALPVCADPLPGCAAYSKAATTTAEQIAAFGAAAARGIAAYASVARESAALYTDADRAGHSGFGG
jgi:hypothetical protein